MTLDAADVKARLNQAGVQAVLRQLGVEKFQTYGPENWLISATYREDRNPSLSINRDDGAWNDKATGDAGGIFDLVMKTTGCDFPESIELVADAAGIVANGKTPHAGNLQPMRRRVTTYPYHDERSDPLYDVDRMSDKTFYPRQPNGTPGYGPRRVLYHLPEILNAGERWVLLCEGEKDVDKLRELGFVATTSPGGANGWNAGKDSYVESLRGRHVAIIPDNDDPGWKYALAAAQSLHGIAAELRVVELPGLGARQRSHGPDVSDWLDAGNTADDLKPIVRDAPAWKPQDAPQAWESAGPTLLIKSMADVESRPIDWLWQRWLARRKIHILGGHPGDGKSLLSAALAAIFSRGGTLPDGTYADRLRTLFLIAEDDVADTVKPRLELHNAVFDDGAITFIEAVREPDKERATFRIDRHLPLLEDAIAAYGIDLLVIDPLSSFMTGSDRNTEDVRDLLVPLTDLAEATGVAILGIMHVGKPNGTTRRPLQQLLGATAFGAVARIVWMLAPASDDPAETGRVLGVVKSNIALKPPSLAWELPGENQPVTWLGESDRDISDLLMPAGRHRSGEMSPERQDILDLLNDADEPMSPQAIADALDKKVSTVRNLLRNMEEDGQVTRPKTGIYTTPTHRCIDFIDSVDAESMKSTESTHLWQGVAVDSALGSQPEPEYVTCPNCRTRLIPGDECPICNEPDKVPF